MAFEKEFLKETNNRIDAAHERIIHCLDQLNEEYIWNRPNPSVNSIGIILQHLCGNLRQCIISGIGGAKDVRNRPLEFKDDAKLSKTELLAKFERIINDCKDAIENFDPNNILKVRRIQGFDESALRAIYGTITHLEFHAGQIIYITRLLIGEQYTLNWVPQTKEQEAE